MLDEWLRILQKKGFAKSTLSAIHAFIHNALNHAVCPCQLIQSNPAEYIKAPKNAPRNVVKRHIISSEQFKALLDKYPFGTPPYIPLMLLYHTGMRISEALSLSWSDIDFTAKRINLWRQISYRSKRGYFFQTPKSKSSEQYILIDDYLLGELRRWQNQQGENEKKFGDSYVYIYREDDGRIIRQPKGLPASAAEKVSLVCTRGNGQMLLKEVLSNVLRHEGLNARAFRHTHTTVLAEIGVPAKVIAGRLDHADATITQNLYTYNTLKLQEETRTSFFGDMRKGNKVMFTFVALFLQVSGKSL